MSASPPENHRKRATCSLLSLPFSWRDSPPELGGSPDCGLRGQGLRHFRAHLSPHGPSPRLLTTRGSQPKSGPGLQGYRVLGSTESLLPPCCSSGPATSAVAARPNVHVDSWSPLRASSNLRTLGGTHQAPCLGVAHPRTRH